MQDKKTFFIGVIAILFFFISFKGCKDNDRQQRPSKTQQSYTKSPVDNLVRDLSGEQNFTIILFDMDYNESSDQYKHQYDVIVEKDDSVYNKRTSWYTVTPTFFQANAENMGMEIASKKDGTVSKTAAPAGYTNYVGNEKYGKWRENSSGGSFWEFYGKYAFMSSMFRMTMFPVRHSYWNDYNRNYYGRGRSYYGPNSNGSRMYGTNSKYNQSSKSASWNNKSSSFKSNVNSKVKQSSSASKSRTTRAATTKTTRSSTRYSSSSTRSRGGSFGK